MTAQGLKHEANLVLWKDRVANCRSSGLPVREWCKQNQVARQTYYHWEKELLKKIGEQLLASKEIEQSDATVFAEIPGQVLIADSESSVVATLKLKNAELKVYSGADAAIVAEMCKAMQNVK